MSRALVHLDLQEHLDLVDIRDPQDTLVNQVSQVREDIEDNQDQLEQMACQEQLEFLAIAGLLDSQENRVM
jgi:hypothetical protein